VRFRGKLIRLKRGWNHGFCEVRKIPIPVYSCSALEELGGNGYLVGFLVKKMRKNLISYERFAIFFTNEFRHGIFLCEVIDDEKVGNYFIDHSLPLFHL